MPGTSEYDNNYKWLDSFKSRSFSPEPEQMMDPAGKPSVKIYASVEPPLQHKKRLGGPATSLSTDYFSVPSAAPDFTLLGQQEKFASNVRYQPKQSGSEPKIYKNKENFGDASPPSKQLKMQKRIKPLMKERHPPVRFPARQSSSKSDLISPPPAPRDVTNSQQLKENLKDKDLRDILGDGSTVGKSVEAPHKDHSGEAVASKPDTSAPAKAIKAKEARASMNASVQTKLKKGVAMAAAEAPVDYALQYKAGVAQERPLWKSSEYQKQFQWRKGAKASPLLAAQEIIHKSNAELGPYKTDGVPRLSEYNRQFQAWKPLCVDLNLNTNNSTVADSKKDEQKLPSKAQRSKSAAAVRRSAPAAAAKEDEREGVAAELKAKLVDTHGKIRRQGTEYRANFKSPTRFGFDHSTWRGASAPQMLPQAADQNNNNNNAAEENGEAAPLSNWFAEVVELRRRAAEYRQRAQGTHFSREHLLQLMAGQNSSWDIASSAGSNGPASDNIRALDLQTRPAAGRSSPINREAPPVDCSHQATEGDTPDMSDVDDQIEDDREEAAVQKKGEKKIKTKGLKSDATKKTKSQGAGRRARKMAWLEEDRRAVGQQARTLEQEDQQQRSDFHGDDNDGEDEVGRLPTPELKRESPERACRHHLDLTTPSVGGAILTCPAPKGSKIIVTSRSGDSYVTASDECPPPSQPKKYNMDHLVTMPILGRPSSDTHPLRDEDCQSDRPLHTRYVATPVATSEDDDKENVEVGGQPQKKRGKASKPSKLSAVQEDFSHTWSQPGLEEVRNKRLAQQADDDAVSLSVMSVASSASLASQVLERARQRQQFWDKDTKA